MLHPAPLRPRPVAALALLAALAAACTDTVVDPVGVAVIEVAPNPATVRVGEALRLQVSLRDSTGNELSRRVAWSSDDPRVAVVDTAGMVRGMAAGVTTIRATAGGRSAEARVAVRLGPVIRLEQPAVRLLAQRDQTTPATADILITNAGDGALEGLRVDVAYAAGQPTGWLQARLAATTAPTTVSLEARPGALPPGDYAATVAVGAPDASEPASLAVTFTVAPPPPGPPAAPRQLVATAVAATEVALSWVPGSTDEREFRIERRTGTSGAWAQVGLAPAGATSHTDAGAPPSSSLHYRILACNGAGCSGYSNEAAVETPAQPVLALDRSALRFSAVAGGQGPAGQTIGVTNTGGSTLTGLAVSTTYAAGEPAGWLDAALDATAAPTVLRVRAHIAGLAVGSYHATLSVSAPGALSSPQTVAVRFDVVAPTPGPQPPTATTLPASGISAAGAMLSGAVTPNLAATAAYFEWGTSATSLAWSTPRMTVGADTLAHTVTAALSGLTPSTTYYFRVVAENAQGRANGAVLGFTTAAAPPPPPAPPAAPSGLTALETGENTVRLGWKDNADNETSYEVERKAPQFGFAKVATLGPDVTSFSDSGLWRRTEYEYRVRACNAAGCSNYSNRVKVRTR